MEDARSETQDALSSLILIISILAAIIGFVAEMPIIATGLLLFAITPTGAALAILHLPRTARLFQPDYREAIALSSGLRPRLSFRARCLFALVLFLSALGIALLVWSLT